MKYTLREFVDTHTSTCSVFKKCETIKGELVPVGKCDCGIENETPKGIEARKHASELMREL